MSEIFNTWREAYKAKHKYYPSKDPNVKRGMKGLKLLLDAFKGEEDKLRAIVEAAKGFKEQRVSPTPQPQVNPADIIRANKGRLSADRKTDRPEATRSVAAQQISNLMAAPGSFPFNVAKKTALAFKDWIED